MILAKFLTSIGASAKDGDTPEYIINRTTDNKIWLEVYQIDPFVPNSSRTVVEFLEDVIKIYPDNSTPSKSKTFKYDKIMPPFALEKDLATTLKKEKLTTRDSRSVERKKYGRRKARRSFQFSKR